MKTTCKICNKIYHAKAYQIKSGRSKFCSIQCHYAWRRIKSKERHLKLVGMMFGRLIITGLNHYDIKRREPWFNCQCKCGNNIEVRRSSLMSGATKSCGCLQVENAKKLQIKPFGYSTKMETWGAFKKSASSREYKNDLTFEQWHYLTQQPCFYCGQLPSNNKKSDFNNGDFIYNGIDRLKNDKGYVIGNVVTCCWKCNKMKLDLNDDKFIEQIKKIHSNMKLSLN
jgi:hypothetical protein